MGDFPDMLFDRVQDPLELDNLIGRPDMTEEEHRLRGQMAEWIAQTPNVAGKPLCPLSLAKTPV
jgi:hypothetical protein